MNPCCPIEGNARAAYLDDLYLLDGRNKPDHPRHGHYTGLIQERAKTLLTFDRKLLATPGLKALPSSSRIIGSSATSTS